MFLYLLTTHFRKCLTTDRHPKDLLTSAFPQFGRNKRHVGALALKCHSAARGCSDLGNYIFLRCHWTLCEEKLTLSPLCLTEGLLLCTTANCCPVISPAALTQSRHSLLNGTSGLSGFFFCSFLLLLTFIDHKAGDFSHLQLHIKANLYLLLQPPLP